MANVEDVIKKDYYDGYKWNGAFKLKSADALQYTWNGHLIEPTTYVEQTRKTSTQSAVIPTNAVVATVQSIGGYSFVDGNSIKHSVVESITYSGSNITPIQQVIPSTVLALPGYGWGVGAAYNRIERTETGWQYVQEVGEVDLGTLTWALNSGTMYCHFSNIKIDSQIIVGKYISTPPKPSVTDVSDGEICTSSIYNRIMIHDNAYTTAAEFKTAMNGVYAYYEMEDPIITDITNLMGDAFSDIKLISELTNVSFNTETDAIVIAKMLYFFPEDHEVPSYVGEWVINESNNDLTILEAPYIYMDGNDLIMEDA